jgi:hypothetical protein
MYRYTQFGMVSDGMLMLYYQGLIPPTIKAIQEQQAEIDSLSAQLASINIQTNYASASAFMNSFTFEDASVSGELNVLGRTVLSDTSVTGKFTTGLLTVNGLDDSVATPAATLNTLSGPLMIQSTGLQGIDLLNGKITIDTSGNLVSTGDITAKTIHADEADFGKLNIQAEDTAAASVGEATIPAGQTSIVITTSAVTDKSKIFVTPHTPVVYGVTSRLEGKSFTITIDKPLNKDLVLDWWVLN